MSLRAKRTVSWLHARTRRQTDVEVRNTVTWELLSADYGGYWFEADVDICHVTLAVNIPGERYEGENGR
jgi:hypothetical protein